MAIARAFTRLTLPIAFVLGIVLTTAVPVAANAGATEYQQVFQTAKSKLGANWVHYARGPNKFDCVGFVWYIYKANELAARIGGYRSPGGYLNWFKERGLVSQSNPRPGDLIIWGANKHVGMYIGDGKAISAMVQPYGVKIHPVKGYLNVKFKAYLHVNIQR